MTEVGPTFQQTWLWQQSFLDPRPDCCPAEQRFFRDQFLSIRDRASFLVRQITVDMPGMTLHDISHADALWDTASMVVKDGMEVNPTEAFVLGCSFLLHDAGMSLAAYPKGIAQIRETRTWKDAIARALLAREENGMCLFDASNPPSDVIHEVTPSVLRQLHAKHAESLAIQEWTLSDGTTQHLIENSDIREFYGPIVGQISHSHWWPVDHIAKMFPEDLGALPGRTRNTVDCVKTACLLRIADALHLDSRRAPRFLRAITHPKGASSHHWTFQERFALPHVEQDSVVFSVGRAFKIDEAEAWWLAFDTVSAVNRELLEVNSLLQSLNRKLLTARDVKGAGSPEVLSRTVRTEGWRPVNTTLQISDVSRIVSNLGGAHLYGDDPTVALRELIQNGTDAIEARRKLQRRDTAWGQIAISLPKRDGKYWLVVEDTGIGMSEMVLTGPLLDFGKSFWRSSLVVEEFPGLLSSGMKAIGRYGIGFYSVFMLGSRVRVYSRRFDRSQETGCLLEFYSGTNSRPILSSNVIDNVPIDGGTRVEVCLDVDPYTRDGLLKSGAGFPKEISLRSLVRAVAPNLNATLIVESGSKSKIAAKLDDWVNISGKKLVKRIKLRTTYFDSRVRKSEYKLMRVLAGGDDQNFGRAFIKPSDYRFSTGGGWISVSGLRATRAYNIQGILCGDSISSSRSVARPFVPAQVLAQWATEQGRLISKQSGDEEHQAKVAEVILRCGGDIGELKIIKLGSEWLNTVEFDQHIQNVSEIAISFDGEFDYDEEEDLVHPKEFRDLFDQRHDVAFVLKHDGTIVRESNVEWPPAPVGHVKANESLVAAQVRDRIKDVWKVTTEAVDEERVVGEVEGEEIVREVTVFRKIAYLGGLSTKRALS